jgi:eukaryotic-like serine/threonine-protein kinase
MLPVSDSSRFRLIEVLGRGGTATVARAWDRATRQYVAVKLRTSDADGTIETFRNAIRREYNLVGDIKAPGLVRILESPSPDYSSLVMELCAGRTIDTLSPVLNVTVALNLISAVAVDLELLRVLGLVHGDIKPHNLYAPSHWNPTFADTLFWVKLSDFSLGRRIDESETARLGRGTIGHMAPETISENTTSHRSDLFGLGILAYQVLTGRHPFLKGYDDPVAVNDRTRDEIPTPLKTLRPEISDEAAAVLDRLLAKSPEERQHSALEVCEALGRAGATYDYRLAIRPAHLIRFGLSYDDNVKTILRLDDRRAESLRELTGERLSDLRLILTGTYLRGGLQYREGGFDVVGRWYQFRRRAVGSVASPLP